MIKSLSYNEKLAWLSVARAEGVGSVTFFKLLDKYKSIEKVLEILPSLKTKSGKLFKLLNKSIHEKELDNVEKFGARIIAFCEPEYPENLRNIYDPPPIITVKGKVEALKLKSVAIVGTRNSSIHSLNFTKNLSKEIGKAGYIIISGLAKGIDTAAHIASIETGTIAVMASGIDKIYPPENENIAKKILENGALVTEAPFGASPRAENFPMRNRIVSALSEGVVVVEAAKRSGSLITARLAAEHGKEVMAVPGFPGDARSEGNNYLLKNGAALVTNAEDVLENIQNPATIKTNKYEGLKENTELYQMVEQDELIDITDNVSELDSLLASLSGCPISIEQLIQSSDLKAERVTALISELELNKKLVRTNGNMVALSEL